ncbi:hypothetical protein ACIQTW_00775 [Paenarthrobacter sp. NPDC090517]|uniref:hypothetical protein n=1 Tax=Paenarthrobacter sp. NPDC090517 TaxID=3364381 RepID=UPI0037FF75ED
MHDSEAIPAGRAMRRVPRWWLIPTVLVMVLAGLGAAYWTGANSVASAGPSSSTPEVIPVSATVERRAVIKQVVLSGKVLAGAAHAIKASPSEGIDRLVMTSAAKTVGSMVAPGELLAAVSGRPLLVLPSGVPLYRDIELGDSGPDVAALHGALAGFGYAVSSADTFETGTQRALIDWYKAAGHEAPTSTPSPKAIKPGDVDSHPLSTKQAPDAVVFRWKEFVQVPGDTGTIAAMAGNGSVLGEDGIVAQVKIADDSIVARADVVQSESFPVGGAVTVRAGSAVLETKVVLVSDFLEGDQSKNEIPGKDITFAVPPGTQGFAADQSVTVTAGSAAAESLAVPLIAVRQEEGVPYVLLEKNGEPRRVNVKVMAQADGWAAIADMDGLAPGDEVKLQ